MIKIIKMISSRMLPSQINEKNPTIKFRLFEKGKVIIV